MTICPKCRTKLLPGARKCHRCGFSEYAVIQAARRKHGQSVVSSNHYIQTLYRKLFGSRSVKKSKKTLGTILLLCLLPILYWHFFIYYDPAEDCFIRIKAGFSELSNVTMKRGLVYLKENFPEEYTNTCSHVTHIHPKKGCGGFGGGCFYYNEPTTIVISTPYGMEKAAAKVIIHETCHVIQYKNGDPMSEAECYGRDSVISYR